MFLQGYLPSILEGTMLTLAISAASLLFSVMFGLTGALFHRASHRSLVWLAALYSNVVRGIPDLVWIFVLFFGGQVAINELAALFDMEAPQVNTLVAGIMTIGFIFGAYMTETFRGAILAIPRGQTEAGYAYGMNHRQVFLRITLPQMIRFALPSLANNWLGLMKTTALVSVIGLPDMMYHADITKSATHQPFTVYLVVAGLYLAITSVSMLLFNLAQKHFTSSLKPTEL